MMIRNINPVGDVIVPSLPVGRRLVPAGGLVWIEDATQAALFLQQTVNWAPADDAALHLCADMETALARYGRVPLTSFPARRSDRTDEFESRRRWDNSASIRHPVALVLRCGQRRLLAAEAARPARITLADRRGGLLVLGEADTFQEEQFAGRGITRWLRLPCAKHGVHPIEGTALRNLLDRLGGGRVRNIQVSEISISDEGEY